MSAPVPGQNRMRTARQEIGKVKEEIKMSLAQQTMIVKMWATKRAASITPFTVIGGLVVGALLVGATGMYFGIASGSEVESPSVTNGAVAADYDPLAYLEVVDETRARIDHLVGERNIDASAYDPLAYLEVVDETRARINEIVEGYRRLEQPDTSLASPEITG